MNRKVTPACENNSSFVKNLKMILNFTQPMKICTIVNLILNII